MARLALRKACVLLGLAVAACSPAFVLDQAKIVIQRALSSPTLTIRYSGANAALAELRVNGASFATRTLDADRASGETNFTLDLGALKEGDNEIEIRLFSRTGKLVGSERQLVYAEPGGEAPVFIRTPKMGSSVFGTVTIEVGFGRPMKNTYVSFFIDNEFKSMSNVAPYSFAWDTEREKNGWHDLEAWIVDDSNLTMKTKKVRVFVDNVGGQTQRNVTPKPAIDKPKPVVKIEPVTKPAPKAVKAQPSVAKQVKPVVAKPQVKVADPVTIANVVNPKTGKSAGLQATKTQAAVASGAKIVIPKLASKPVAKSAVAAAPAVKLSNAGGLTPIKKGTKLPEAGKFSIVLEDKFVDFDVQPRVEKGVPMTPFRHLFEQAGGKVDWDNVKKRVEAEGLGKIIMITIGDVMAKVNGVPMSLELAPYIENGRTIVPLSFIREALEVEVDYDRATGHVLITKASKN